MTSASPSRLARIASAYERHVVQLHQEPRLLATAAFRESIDAVVIFVAALFVLVLGGGFWRAAWREVVRR